MTTKFRRTPGWPEEGATFGARLRAARLEAGLTLRQVAEPSGLSLNYLSDLERDVLSNPALEKLRALAFTLNVSIDSLLGLPSSDIPQGRDVPEPLAQFVETEEFQSAVEQESKRWKVDRALIAQAWVEALAGIRVHGHTPRRSIDYLFVFEAARRAVEDH